MKSTADDHALSNEKGAKKDGFAQVRWSLLDSGLSGEAIGLLTIYALHANHATDLAWPCLATLRKITGWGKNRIVKYRRELVKAGYLQPIRGRSQGGLFGGTTYKLTKKAIW